MQLLSKNCMCMCLGDWPCLRVPCSPVLGRTGYVVCACAFSFHHGKPHPIRQLDGRERDVSVISVNHISRSWNTAR